MDADANNPREMQHMAENCEHETSEFIVSVAREESKKQANWAELPSVPLEKIYSFLDRWQRAKMSLVCRKWSEGYSSPSAWKKFRFALMPLMIKKDSCPGMKFVPKYSSMFQHVDIYYYALFPAQGDLIYIWREYFILFLQLLTSNSQLMSIKIYGLSWFFRFVDTSIGDDVKRAIASFLRSQRYLKRVEIGDCFKNLQEYVELLKELPENSRNSITHFGVRGLTLCDSLAKAKQHDSTAENSLLAFISLPSLTTLAVDYSWIFENTFSRQSVVMKILKRSQTYVKISKIILDYDSCCDIENFQGLKSTDWQFLKKIYPDLQVKLNFKTRVPTRRDVEFLIVPDMPIAWLNFTDDVGHYVESNDSSHMEIDVLFGRLLQCKTSDYLVSLCFTWYLPIPDVASTFIPVLQACKKLEYFELLNYYPSSGIDRLMESWLENRPESLKKVLIQISDVEDDHEHKVLEKLIPKYVSALELVGLNAIVKLY